MIRKLMTWISFVWIRLRNSVIWNDYQLSSLSDINPMLHICKHNNYNQRGILKIYRKHTYNQYMIWVSYVNCFVIFLASLMIHAMTKNKTLCHSSAYLDSFFFFKGSLVSSCIVSTDPIYQLFVFHEWKIWNRGSVIESVS
jgi:hypothetical protein